MSGEALPRHTPRSGTERRLTAGNPRPTGKWAPSSEKKAKKETKFRNI